MLCSLYLAKKHSANEAVGAAEIADAESIPLQYTHQILQRLRKGGIISSVRGPHGGYKLTADPEKINLKQIMIAVEDDTFQVMCDTHPIENEQRCNPMSDCGLRVVWQDLKQSIDQMLEQRTLAWLVQRDSQTNLVKLSTERPSAPPAA